MTAPNDPDRSGLDYLYRTKKLNPQQETSSSSSVRSSTTDLDASIRAYAFMRVLDAIKRATEHEKGVRLSRISKDVEMGPEALVPLAQRLTEAGLLEVVEPAWGDDAVALTDRGRTVVDEGRDQELVRLLALAQ